MTDNTDKLRVENETLRNENCDLSMRLECAETELEDVLDRLNDEKRSGHGSQRKLTLCAARSES